VENPEANDFLKDAIREFEEETGVTIKDPDAKFIPLGSVVQNSGKLIFAWAVEADLSGPFRSNTFPLEWPPKSGKSQQFPEIDHWKYWPLDTAKQKIVGKQIEFLDRLQKHLDNMES
jgi:predicted NUDIX family NTP pyrophosphohydrolase